MSKGKVVPRFSLNSFVAPPTKEWYKDLTFEDSIDMAKEKMVETAENFVALGYYLKHIWDKELYVDKGYHSIWECAESELHLTQSTASRYIEMCRKFSKNGDSPYLEDRYKEFGKCQLQEMLTIDSKELMEKVKPDMSVRKIRALKKRVNTEGRQDNFGSILGQPEVVEGAYREFKAGETASKLAEQKEKEEESDTDKKTNEESVYKRSEGKKSKTVSYSEFSFALLPTNWLSINKTENDEGVSVTFGYE